MNPLDAARAFVATRYPDALAALLGGSAASGAATATSDLDIVVLVPDGHASYAETTRFGGWIVEAFVDTRRAAEAWFEREAAERRPVLAELCASGVLVLDAPEGRALQQDATRWMATGPEPLTELERDLLRYALSNLVDDLVGGASESETFALLAETFRIAAELLLTASGRWIGSGKWLVRRLAQAPDLPTARRLVAWASSDRSAAGLVPIAHAVLDEAGGRLVEGMVCGDKHGGNAAPA